MEGLSKVVIIKNAHFPVNRAHVSVHYVKRIASRFDYAQNLDSKGFSDDHDKLKKFYYLNIDVKRRVKQKNKSLKLQIKYASCK